MPHSQPIDHALKSRKFPWHQEEVFVDAENGGTSRRTEQPPMVFGSKEPQVLSFDGRSTVK